MTDFMRWLYAHYIKPEIEDSDATGYEAALSLMDTNLNSELREQYARTLEFYASRAFCLGFYTGQGFAQSSQASFGSTQPSI